MTYILLRIVDAFRWLYESMGVDFRQLRAIVGTKLVMDNRRNVIAFRQQQHKEKTSGFIYVVLLYAFFGIFLAAAITALPSFLVGMTLYHSFLMVMLAMTLISDFSSVLLDTSDNTIILPRPVSGQTLLAARTTHIVLYLGQLTLGLVIAPFIATLLRYGMGTSILLLITTLLSVLFTVILTHGLYLLLMHLVSEERLKSVINYFQIGMAITMMGAYQILPRMMSSNLIRETEFSLSWWSVFVPPLWMAGTLDSFHSQIIDPIHILLLALTISVPLAGLYVTTTYLAPQFTKMLADLGGTSGLEPVAAKKEIWNNSRFQVSTWITKPGLERAAYELVRTMLPRDRKLKLKIYPAIGYLIILAVVFVSRGNESLQQMIRDLPHRSVHIFMIYSAYLMVQVAFHEISYTDEFHAAWIYSSSPIAAPGEILSGTWKAVLVKFFLPIYLILSVLILIIWKAGGIDDIIFGLASNVFLFLLMAKLSDKHFPFSMEPSVRNRAGGFARSLITLIMIALVGYGHFLLAKVPFALWAGLPILLIIDYYLLKEYQQTPWRKIVF